MSGLTGTVYDETYDLDILAGTTHALTLPYVTEFNLDILILIPPPLTQPLIVFAVLARDLTIEATVGITAFPISARDLTVTALDNDLRMTVSARDMRIEAVIGLTAFTVPARDMRVEAVAT